MNSRKGLKRLGMRSYVVSGPKGEMVIERERAWRWFVKPASHGRQYGGFFAQQFRRLHQARSWAERQAGIFDDFPDPTMPKFLRRMPWPPEKRVRS